MSAPLWHAAGILTAEAARGQKEMQQLLDKGIHWSVQTVKVLLDEDGALPPKTKNGATPPPFAAAQGDDAAEYHRLTSRLGKGAAVKAKGTYKWGERTFEFPKEKEEEVRRGVSSFTAPQPPQRTPHGGKDTGVWRSSSDTVGASLPQFERTRIAIRDRVALMHRAEAVRMEKQDAAVRPERSLCREVSARARTRAVPSRQCHAHRLYGDTDGGTAR
ncbi:hypothetical protein T484DRAFT_1802974 [Baffinella frigidus]|nr:hypothetical protein T484DRAFT_1802974 [Cryptophyta sp. CCMP2293]